MGGGEPRGCAHGAGAGSDDELASRQNACHFRDHIGLVSSRPSTAHCSRRTPGCSGNLGVFVGVLFLAGCGAYPLLAGVQVASAPAFQANPDCVPTPACGWLMCAAPVTSGTGVPSIMANAGGAEQRQCVGGQCKVEMGVQSHLHTTGAFLSCPLSAHAQRPDVMSRTRRRPARGCEAADASSKLFLRRRQLLGARTVRPKPSRGC